MLIEANKLVNMVFPHAGKLLAHEQQLTQVSRFEGGGVRRCTQQEVAYQLGVSHQVGVVAIHGVGVAQ